MNPSDLTTRALHIRMKKLRRDLKRDGYRSNHKDRMRDQLEACKEEYDSRPNRCPWCNGPTKLDERGSPLMCDDCTPQPDVDLGKKYSEAPPL